MTNQSTIAALNEHVVLLTPDGPQDGIITARHPDGTVTIELSLTSTMPEFTVRAEAVKIYKICNQPQT